MLCWLSLWARRPSTLLTLQPIPQPGTAWKSVQYPKESVPNSCEARERGEVRRGKREQHQAGAERKAGRGRCGDRLVTRQFLPSSDADMIIIKWLSHDMGQGADQEEEEQFTANASN